MSSEPLPPPPGAIPKGTPAALQLVKCKLSASLLPGNLHTSAKHYAYIHRNEIQLIDQKVVALGNDKAETVKAVAYTEKDVLNQIEFIKIPQLGGEVLVAINQAAGIFIFDDAGQKLLHSYKHVRGNGVALTLKEQHLRGIAYDGKETLYVGQGSGDILVLSVTKAKLTYVKSLTDVHNETQATSGGVSALTYVAKDNVLVSGDDYGNLAFWAGSGADLTPAKSTRLDGKGSPVNLLAYGHGHVVAAFASGHIRLYDAAKRQITCEIAAHTRAINGLDLHHTRPLVMCAAEDTFVSVWQLPTPAAPQVKHLMAESPMLGLLTGARFGGANQELIVTTTYDNRSLALMHTP